MNNSILYIILVIKSCQNNAVDLYQFDYLLLLMVFWLLSLSLSDLTIHNYDQVHLDWIKLKL